jgi:hypothetical protein
VFPAAVVFGLVVVAAEWCEIVNKAHIPTFSN